MPIREEQAKALNVANRESSQQLLPSDVLLGTPFRSFSATDPIVRGKWQSNNVFFGECY